MENTKIKPKSTQTGCSYWNETGAYSKEIKQLYTDIVPISGKAKTLNGELIRAISRLSHEYHNNGNLNACEISYEHESYPCYDCGGSGIIEDYDDEEIDCYSCDGMGTLDEEVESDGVIDSFYAMFLELIEWAIPDTTNEVNEIENFITQDHYNNPDQFNPKYEKLYSDLIDKVMYYVLTHSDKEIPNWYTN